MNRVYLKALGSRKQLRDISFQKVISTGFTDDSEQIFEIEFEIANGQAQDLTISFETRTPRIYISTPYNK